MAISPSILSVFGHFQNLNLLALLHDLRADRAARSAWRNGSKLCPIAHGLAHGAEVREVAALGQIADLGHGCDFAARHLGARADAVLRFVRSWDQGTISRACLVRELEEIWEERLEDAEAAQELLQGVPDIQKFKECGRLTTQEMTPSTRDSQQACHDLKAISAHLASQHEER